MTTLQESAPVVVRGAPVTALRAPGTGPALVLLHGAGASREVWRPLLAKWGALDVWAFSLPGRVGSPHPAATTVDAASSWLGEVLDAYGLTRPFLLGHSYGGGVALARALDHPATVAGLIMVSSAARLRVAPALLEAAALATNTNPLPVEPTFGPNAPAEAVRTYAEAASSVPPGATLADWTACDRFDRVADTSTLARPLLIVHGDDDLFTPAKRQRVLAESVPGAVRHELPGVGHMPPWEAPDLFVETVSRWIAAQAG